ncbi:hypothetical protein F4821DRAFT_276290 [Hypoxylon rubiginosum]|uniref:Uncharacterized protein n=1 Tax=Hypoxylon rubiginosum TaxID=110542 RepID=A0ACC0D8U7_9PEZI|nr:hypothetical protein F4821DRAFT_276290 [Hypoxylon rubiginosum]
MSDFAIILTEDSDTSSSLRLEGKELRDVLIEQGNLGRKFIARAEIVAVTSGTLTENGPPATIMVFRFNFMNMKEDIKRRFRMAKIKIEFSDELSRSRMDPEVIAVSPNGEVHLNKVARPEDIDKDIHASETPFDIRDIGFEWKVSHTKKKEYWARQLGLEWNNRTTFTGSPNVAIWQLLENPSKRQGIPRFFQTAVLLQRSGDSKVATKITIETEVDTLNYYRKDSKRLFGGVVTEPVDPVKISPKLFKISHLDAADKLKENSPALKSMKTLIKMRKFTGVKRRLAMESVGDEQKDEQKDETVE